MGKLVCTNRVYVQAGVYEAFSQLIAEKVGALQLGNGLDEGTAQGPLIDEQAVAKVESSKVK